MNLFFCLSHPHPTKEILPLSTLAVELGALISHMFLLPPGK